MQTQYKFNYSNLPSYDQYKHSDWAQKVNPGRCDSIRTQHGILGFLLTIQYKIMSN